MNPEDVLRELKDPDRWMNVRVPRSRAAERRGVAPARAVQLVAAFAIAVLAIAGILVGLEAARHGAPPAATSNPSAPSTPSTAVSPSAAPTSEAGFTVVPGVRHEYSAGALPPACTLAQLQTASKQDGGGAAGSYIQTISMRNGGRDCLLGADAVRVGGAVATLSSDRSGRGLLLPAEGTATLTVTTASACRPGGTESNVDRTEPVLPITVGVGGRSRTMTARFPASRCTQPRTFAQLDPSASLDPAIPAPQARVDQPSATPVGPLEYGVDLVNPGTTAITTCPTATEVLENGNGTTVTRALTLRCPAGATLQPGLPVHLTVTTTAPAAWDWTISWFLGGTYSAGVATFTCSASQLRVSEPDSPGGATGNWVQVVTVENRGATCDLPVGAFSIGGRVAVSGPKRGTEGFLVAAATTTQLTVSAPTTCTDGTLNITDVRSGGLNDKPIVLTLGGTALGGLDRAFPQLHCTGPVVARL